MSPGPLESLETPLQDLPPSPDSLRPAFCGWDGRALSAVLPQWNQTKCFLLLPGFRLSIIRLKLIPVIAGTCSLFLLILKNIVPSGYSTLA